MNREKAHEQDVAIVRTLARLADMLEYASWDYPDDASEAKTMVAEADKLLDKLRFKES